MRRAKRDRDNGANPLAEDGSPNARNDSTSRMACRAIGCRIVAVVLDSRPCGKLMFVPSAAKPPPTDIVGSPEFRGSVAASATPGKGLPAASVKMVAAFSPSSCTARSIRLREYPKRSSLINAEENVCTSLNMMDRWTGSPWFPPVSGVDPPIKLDARYSIHRPDSSPFAPSR